MTQTIQFDLILLENDLVELRPLADSDLEELYAVAADPLIWEQHPKKDRWKREIFESFFKKALAGGLSFAIIDKQTGNIIGSSRYYDIDQVNSTVAIGYTFLARKYWGGEYNRSVKLLMIAYAFNYFEKVVFHIGTKNIRSQKAIEKLGSVRTRLLQVDTENDHERFEYTIQRAERA